MSAHRAKAGNTSPLEVIHTIHSQTLRAIRVQSSLMHIFGLWEGPGVLSETNTDMGRACQLHSEKQIKNDPISALKS